MAGMKETKDALALAMSLHMAYDKAAADGNVNWADLQYMMGPGLKLLPALQGASKIPAELKDMNDAEKVELMEWARAEYDLADDVLEKRVEAGLALVVHIAQFVGALLPADSSK